MPVVSTGFLSLRLLKKRNPKIARASDASVARRVSQRFKIEAPLLQRARDNAVRSKREVEATT